MPWPAWWLLAAIGYLVVSLGVAIAAAHVLHARPTHRMPWRCRQFGHDWSDLRNKCTRCGVRFLMDG